MAAEEWRYYFDENTQTLRRYSGELGQRWVQDQKVWTSTGCCPESACQWDERLSKREVPFTETDVVMAAEKFLATKFKEEVI